MAGGTAVSSSSGHLHPTSCIRIDQRDCRSHHGTIEWDTVVACVVRGRGISMSLWTACQQKTEENFASKEQSVHVVPLCGVDDDDALSPGITSQQFLEQPVHGYGSTKSNEVDPWANSITTSANYNCTFVTTTAFTVTANFAKSAQICREFMDTFAVVPRWLDGTVAPAGKSLGLHIHHPGG